MSDLTQPSQPTEPPTEEETFDPIREIKRLRRDLTHRLQELQEKHAEEPARILVEVPPPKTARNTKRDNIAPQKPAGEELSRLEKESLSFNQRLQQAKNVLERLRISRNEFDYVLPEFSRQDAEQETAEHRPTPQGSPDVFEPDAFEEVHSKSLAERGPNTCRCDERHQTCCETGENEKTVEIAVPPAEAASPNRLFVKPESTAPKTPAFLKTANSGLTLLGILGTLAGVAICVRDGSVVLNPGIVLILAGALLITVGFTGRFLANSFEHKTVTSTF